MSEMKEEPQTRTTGLQGKLEIDIHVKRSKTGEQKKRQYVQKDKVNQTYQSSIKSYSDLKKVNGLVTGLAGIGPNAGNPMEKLQMKSKVLNQAAKKNAKGKNTDLGNY